MIVTVLWEDKRGSLSEGFGPDELLVACLVDKTGRARHELKNFVKPVPKKGVGNVLKALREDLRRLDKAGPVVAVLDRDRIRDVWKQVGPPADCMTAICQRIHAEAQGSYEVVFLKDNVETLVDACCAALNASRPASKPSPDERDLYLGEAVRAAPAVRDAVLKACPSFERLVEKVSALLP